MYNGNYNGFLLIWTCPINAETAGFALLLKVKRNLKKSAINQRKTHIDEAGLAQSDLCNLAKSFHWAKAWSTNAEATKANCTAMTLLLG